jgi:HPr kinase/phosphorylase
MSMLPLRLHATTIAIDGEAVLLRGQPGAGKSDLALRLIEAGALLVTDDQTLLRRDGDRLIAYGPKRIKGLFEVRGLGILRFEAIDEAPVALLVDLVKPEAVERMPERRSEELLGLAVPLIILSPFETSAAAKVRLARRAFAAQLVGGIVRP